MGSPYLISTESIILSTNNIFVNTVPAEAILTNERLMLIDTRHLELRPQDIPFPAIETVTIGENSAMDPMLSLSILTAPGVTQSLGIIFPQPPRIKRVAERDEWAARLKELSIISARERGTIAMSILPPWVPGPIPDETNGEVDRAEAESPFRNPPLAPRKPREPVASKNRTAVTAVVVVVVVIALAAGAYVFAPSLFGKGGTPPPTVTPVPTAAQTTVPATVPTPVFTPVTTATAMAPVTTALTTAPVAIIPKTGVWLQVKYEGSFSGSAEGALRALPRTGLPDSLVLLHRFDDRRIAEFGGSQLHSRCQRGQPRQRRQCEPAA